MIFDCKCYKNIIKNIEDLDNINPTCVCIICDKIICDDCKINNFINIKTNKTDYIYTICILCLNNFILKTKNIIIFNFFNEINELIVSDIVNYTFKDDENNNCNACLNFNEIFNENFNYIINYNYDLNDFSLNKNNKNCFNKNCYYCFLKLFKINESNKKFLNIISAKIFNILYSFNDKIISINNELVHNYVSYKKTIININKVNNKIPIYLIIVEKYNNYDSIYQKNFKQLFIKKNLDKINYTINKIKNINKEVYKYNDLEISNKINVKYLLEYIKDKENFNIDDYKFYYYYNLINENIKNYFLDKNNFKHVDNLDLYNNIYTFDEITELQENLRKKSEGYNYAMTLDIKDAFNSVKIFNRSRSFLYNQFFANFKYFIQNYLHEYITNNNIYDDILDYFKKIKNINKKCSLPLSPISPYIFKIVMHKILNLNYTDDILIYVFCDDIIIFGNNLNILLENLEMIAKNINLFNFKINIDKIKFFNLKYQNLFFLNTCFKPSPIFNKIIQKWKENTYKPGSKFYYNLEKEFNKKINILNKEN